MSDRLTPTNVSKRLDVSVSTVRRLTGEYADWLSPAANPRPGGTRIYTEQDVDVLSVIVAMRQDGAPEDEIIRAIESGVIPATVAPVEPVNPFSALPAPVIVKVDTTAIAEQIAPLAAAVRESNESTDRLAAAIERAASALIVFAVLLLAIVLITVAVAVGWL